MKLGPQLLHNVAGGFPHGVVPVSHVSHEVAGGVITQVKQSISGVFNLHRGRFRLVERVRFFLRWYLHL